MYLRWSYTELSRSEEEDITIAFSLAPVRINLHPMQGKIMHRPVMNESK